MANNKAFKVKNGLELEAYSKAISDTAVDIFVYDTRKDSDGGAWRKRTQHTSWYNETLNTATRGSRKEFPAVAVIVAESNQVTIYDGDDPDLPMWKTGTIGVSGTWTSTIGGDWNIKAVSAVNGNISVLSTHPSYSGYGSANVYSFVDDTYYRYSSGGDISSYKFYLDYSNGNTSSVSPLNNIVSNFVNDVAMTVLPNAPIDAATGLPVPTIAVATAGGISVIRDDGTVTDSATAINFTHISANEDGFAYGYDVFENYVVVSYEATATDGWTPDITNIYYGGSGGMSPLATAHNSTNATDALAAYSQGNNIGLTNWDIKRGGGAYEKLFNYTTSDYNTGWMNGDIKLATLSDTDDTNVTGAELVTNGTFDSDTSGWTADGSGDITFSSVGSTLQIVRGSGNVAGAAYQAVTVEVGKTYTFSANVTSGTMSVRVGTAISGNQYKDLNTQTGEMSCTFTATSTTVYITLWPQSPSTTANIDNISVRLAEEDRSVNGNGLQVFGTVTKSAVATGADLVGYSGWSTSNYLSQPYNSDLDLGTADFCVMIWVKRGSPPSYAGIISYGNGDNTTNKGWLVRVSTSYRVEFRSDAAGGGSLIAATEDALTATWTHVCFVRSGGTLSLYQNGSFLNSTAGYTADLEAGTSATLDIGTNQANDSLNVTTNAFVGSLALARVSATAPSPEQIAKIYEDEKVLFQDGAQATLYGSSDAVTALAYDDSTELLHVGTSAGRSVFQGLRRVDNTTTAVGAAISASNGLVADE